MDARLPASLDRKQLAWWLVGAALVGALAFFAYSFVGTLVLGLFIYYGARPVFRRLLHATDSRTLAATVTLLLIVVPTLLLLAYTATVAFQQFSTAAGQAFTNQLLKRVGGNQQSVAAVVRDPMQFVRSLNNLPQVQDGVSAILTALGALSGWLFHVSMSLVIAFFLYRDGNRLREWFAAEAGEESAAYAYAGAADRDLEYVYFGNVLSVSVVTVLSVVVYNAFAFVSPASISVPVPTLLAVLTGVATFIPIVVGKVVYLPVSAYLFWQAFRQGTGTLWFPAAFLVVAFLLLDIIPQSVIRPYLSGRTIHNGMVLFAYVMGAALFGWYGLFLGPLVLVLVVQFANVVVPELVRGESVTPRPTGATEMGTDPSEGIVPGSVPDETEAGAAPAEEADAAADPDATTGDATDPAAAASAADDSVRRGEGSEG